ncbi:MAG: hypothetical protein ACKODX_19195 [Gemmata sp.]
MSDDKPAVASPAGFNVDQLTPVCLPTLHNPAFANNTRRCLAQRVQEEGPITA